jgi:hypothetical protein
MGKRKASIDPDQNIDERKRNEYQKLTQFSFYSLKAQINLELKTQSAPRSKHTSSWL